MAIDLAEDGCPFESDQGHEGHQVYDRAWCPGRKGEIMHDLEDPLIRTMIYKTHRPKETFGHNGYVYYLVEVKCSQCKEKWPCEAQQRLRSWHRSKREAAES